MKKFKVEIKKTVARKLKKLPRETLKKVVLALKELEEDPFPKGKKVKPFVGRPKTYRLRVGDYRIIYKLESETIIVLELFHRKDLTKFK